MKKVLIASLAVIAIISIALFQIFQKKPASVTSVTNQPQPSPTVTTTPSVTDKKPTPPDGYDWQECTTLKAAFLKPQGWFFKEENGVGNTVACFITKQEITGASSQFQTGLSANGIKNVQQKTGLTPTAFTKQSFSDPKRLVKHRANLEPLTVGALKGYGQLMQTQDPGEAPITMYLIVLGNDKTGSAYVIWFETPSANWANDSKIGQTMMNELEVDDEF